MADKTSVETLTPKAIVAALDRYIVGQGAAKRSVARGQRREIRIQKLKEVYPSFHETA